MQTIGTPEQPRQLQVEDQSAATTDQSVELYQLAPEPKELVVIPGADHNDSELVGGPAVVEAIVRFAREASTG